MFRPKISKSYIPIFRFESYSEIELQCRGEDNTNYPFLNAIIQSYDKLIASFSTSSTSPKSSICVFSMQKVKLTFWYNVDRCRSGTDSIRLPHIGRDTKCVNASFRFFNEEIISLFRKPTYPSTKIAVSSVLVDQLNLLRCPQKTLWER